jgi:hypothetical protein
MSFRTVQGDNVEVAVRRDTSGRIIIQGRIHRFAGERQRIQWISPNKPTRGIGFNGSGLPFANSEQAFENTPFRGTIDSADGSFSLEMSSLPNAYYTGLGSTYVPPVLMLETFSKEGSFRTHVFLSPVSVPYRWIAGSPPGRRVPPAEDEVGRAMYYNGREALGLFENQEALLRAKGYPADNANHGLPDHIDAYPWLHTPAPA